MVVSRSRSSRSASGLRTGQPQVALRSAADLQQRCLVPDLAAVGHQSWKLKILFHQRTSHQREGV